MQLFLHASKLVCLWDKLKATRNAFSDSASQASARAGMEPGSRNTSASSTAKVYWTRCTLRWGDWKVLVHEDVMEFFSTKHLQDYTNNNFMCYIPLNMNTYGDFMPVDLK